MGIVIKQSVQNTFSTYLGFGVGAINTLFLYTNFLTDEYYGLVGFLLSAATIMMPLMAFGVHNTLIKFYTSYKTAGEQQNFVTTMLFLPLLLILPIGLIGYISYETITNFLAKENAIIEDYTWIIYLTAISMAYFEIFYAWARIKMQSATGNLLKEVFHRVVIMILLFGVYFELVSVHLFIWLLVAVYFLRMLIMFVFALRLNFPKLAFRIPHNIIPVLKYSFLIIIAGSVSLLLLDIDKVMLGKLIPIENVAYYNVAIFIATVIAVPARSMHQITYPLTAKFINEKSSDKLKELYVKSSLTLFIVSGLLFLLIVLNIKELYTLLPEEYATGLFVVILISSSKLLDNLMGINNAILYNSEYYRLTIVLGVLLAILTIVLNLVFIPILGMEGAAIATVISLLLYSFAKIAVVNVKFKMHPFTFETGKTFLLILITTFAFFFWDFNFHSVMNILLKSLLISVLYLLVVYKGKLSEDISDFMKRFLPF
ncbi:lipopolysaccharide biosynthesis protein [Planktosalinus lacus]|uniref:Polysaccharide biosynthesis protein n=1 Tax=Planktosalinus lacus TaxID=1526573 RepID=A0A8J2VCM9_9FLAO|nr:oligosaccharide flippase family protein [Planktosalinus lacus]GGD98591.1 polysaccharide biosynthesis protein [Planktosalinus lacus]